MKTSYTELGAAVTIAEPCSAAEPCSVDGREGPLVHESVDGSYISQSDLPYPPQTKTTLPEDDEVAITAQEGSLLVLSIDATGFQMFF